MGPAHKGMICPACARPFMAGLIDTHGTPYLKCESCKFRALGLDISGGSVEGLRTNPRPPARAPRANDPEALLDAARSLLPQARAERGVIDVREARRAHGGA